MAGAPKTGRFVALALLACAVGCDALLGIGPLPGEDASVDATTDVTNGDASDASDGGFEASDAGDACATKCGNTCVDLQSDPNNCGACGHSCGDAGYGCNAGGCGNEAVSVAAGHGHACAVLRGGEIWCWGFNVEDECGVAGSGPCANGGNACEYYPVKVALQNVVAAAAGGNFTCALDTTGQVWCWGDNTHRQLDRDGGGGSVPQLAPLPAKAKAIAAGGEAACAITVTGDVYCWGLHECGALGIGTQGATDASAFTDLGPQFVMDGGALVAMSDPAGEGASTCVIKTDGTTWCWGDDTYGGLGTQSGAVQCFITSGNECLVSPTQVFMLSGSATGVGTGYVSCAAIGGKVYCVGGNNGTGALGNGVTSGVGSLTPVAVNLPSNKTWVDVAVGGGHACARASTGEVYCWGAAACGQIGIGYDDAGLPAAQDCSGTPCWATPQQVGALDASAITAGNRSTYAVVGGRVYSWGFNDFGELGHDAGTSGDNHDAAAGWTNALPSEISKLP